MQIFGHFHQFVWADLWTLGQNRGQVLLPIGVEIFRPAPPQMLECLSWPV